MSFTVITLGSAAIAASTSIYFIHRGASPLALLGAAPIATVIGLVGGYELVSNIPKKSFPQGLNGGPAMLTAVATFILSSSVIGYGSFVLMAKYLC